MKRFWIGATLISMMMVSATALAQYPDDDDDDDSSESSSSSSSTSYSSSSSDSGGGNIPGEMTVGVSAGVQFPGDVRVFNFFSTKVHLGSGMQIEPFLIAGIGRGSHTTDDGTNDTEDLDGDTSVALGARVHHPFKTGKNVRWHLVGEGVFAFNNNEVDPEGPDNSVTTASTGLGLGYGIGVEWWFWKTVSLSAVATNPLVTFNNTKTTTATAGDDFVDNVRNFDFLVQWNPTVVAAFTVWFN